jgi:hypothetical protein
MEGILLACSLFLGLVIPLDDDLPARLERVILLVQGDGSRRTFFFSTWGGATLLYVQAWLPYGHVGEPNRQANSSSAVLAVLAQGKAIHQFTICNRKPLVVALRTISDELSLWSLPYHMVHNQASPV